MIKRTYGSSSTNRQQHSTKGILRSQSTEYIRTKPKNKLELLPFNKFVAAFNKGQESFIIRSITNIEQIQKHLDYAEKNSRRCTFYIPDTVMNKTVNIHNQKLIGINFPCRHSLLSLNIQLNGGNWINGIITGTPGRQHNVPYTGHDPPLIQTDSKTFTGDSLFLSGQNGEINNIAVTGSLNFPFIKYASGSELGKIKKPTNIRYLNTHLIRQEIWQKENSWSRWAYNTSSNIASAIGNAVSDCYQVCHDCSDWCEECLKPKTSTRYSTSRNHSEALFSDCDDEEYFFSNETPSQVTTQPSSSSNSTDTCPADGGPNTCSSASWYGGNSTEN